MAATLYPLYTISRFDLARIDTNVDKSYIQNMITLLKPQIFEEKNNTRLIKEQT